MTDHTLRRMISSDLSRVFEWRNNPDVRRFMYTTHELTWEEHCAWFERACKNDKVSLLIYEFEGAPRGFVNISSRRSQDVADWGFYLAPDAPAGTGQRLGQAVLSYAFRHLGLHKLCGEVLGFNERSLRFHQRLGFVQEGRLREHHFDGDHYHDVVCFGLLKSEWELFTPGENHVS